MNDTTRAPIVWLINDHKAGHRNQLKGLGNRLRVLAGAELHWVNAQEFAVPLWRALVGRPPSLRPQLPAPDLMIAAGTGTHRLLLALRRSKHARSIVLMKPAFPLAWVHAAIIPAHDDIKPTRNILMTEGVINAVTPLARLTDKPEALILLGGPSRHYQWDNDALLAQIRELMAGYPDWRWTISDSRRTPESLTRRLSELQRLKVTVVSHQQTHDSWLNHQLAASRAAWVTPDSLSMVCEAATSGVPTGLLPLPARPGSRVVKGIERLLQQGMIAPWADHAAVMAPQAEQRQTLWEADRAARWLVDRYLRSQHNNRKSKA